MVTGVSLKEVRQETFNLEMETKRAASNLMTRKKQLFNAFGS